MNKELSTPFFTTEDGVKIFEDDTYFSVHIERGSMWLVNRCKAYACTQDYRMPEKYKFFAFEEAAEEYILLNKPCLSVQEVINALNIRDAEKHFLLTTLVKQKTKS